MNFLDELGLEELWRNIISKLSKKVDKEDGKGLSSNDFTTEEKEKLARLQETVQIDIDSALNSTSENPVQNKIISAAITNLTDLISSTITNEEVDEICGAIIYDSSEVQV